MHTNTRVISGIVAALVLAPISGCGTIQGMTGNKSEVCQDTKAAFTDFGEQLNTVSPTDGTQWAKITGDFAGRLDKLGTEASDKKLKKVLADFAGSWRKASPEIAQKGDVAQLTVLLRDQPGQLGRACS
jgi:hypothetical protein